MTWGGVATRSGDFLCTIMVERCLVVAAPEKLCGEKAAIVGVFGS